MFTPNTPLATYDDAIVMQRLVTTGAADDAMFSPDDLETITQFRVDLAAIVSDGPDAFDDADMNVVLGGSAALVGMLSELDCDGYLP